MNLLAQKCQEMSGDIWPSEGKKREEFTGRQRWNSHSTCPFIVSFTIRHGDFPLMLV